MQLSNALRLKPGFAIAFVGAGGKSSATRRIVDEMSGELPVLGPHRPGTGQAPWPAGAWAAGTSDLQDRQMSDEFMFVLITTTTRLGESQKDLANHHLIDPSEDQMASLPDLLEDQRSVLITGPDLEDKWIPPKDSVLSGLHKIAKEKGALLLIEADGARGRSLKAPDKHEPVIPEFVDLVVPMAGLDILGQTTRSEAIHRPELVSVLLRSRKETEIGPAELAAVIGSDKGGLKGIPDGAKVRVLLNKAGDAGAEPGGQVAQRLLKNPRIQSVVLASLREDDAVIEAHGRVAGIILAAGGSSRLGEPKQVIQWRGHPLIWHAVRAAEGLHPVAVVIGEAAAELRRALKKEPVEIIENADWEAGQSSSVRIGLEAIPPEAEAVVFLLADMPFVTQELVSALVQRYRQTLAPLVATWAGGRRANPVLFDRETFSDLMELKGDQGGRAIFRRFEREFVEWDDPVLLDVDTPEDLERLKSLE